MPRPANDVGKLAKEARVKIMDLRFVDLAGMCQHFSIPAEDLRGGSDPHAEYHLRCEGWDGG
jgi:glutamine synthetase